MITGAQIRAARALLNWTAQQAAQAAGVTRQTLVKFESYDEIPPSRTQSLVDLKKAFEKAGVEFVGGLGEGVGVRLRRKP